MSAIKGAGGPSTFARDDRLYPNTLIDRLGDEAPMVVRFIGAKDVLGRPKLALFCSARCPGEVILAAHDQASRWREEGTCIISGFHSPVEKDCLRILLRGHQPIIMCPGYGINRMRLSSELKRAMEDGRLLILSPFSCSIRRVTKRFAVQRNRFVAALADEIVFAYVSPGGHLEDLQRMATIWGMPNRCLGACETVSHKNL